MEEILAHKLLPKALKSCPKPNKSPNLVTLDEGKYIFEGAEGQIVLTTNLINISQSYLQL